MTATRITLALAAAISLGCSKAPVAAPVSVVGFNEMFGSARTVALSPSADDPIDYPTQALVAGDQLLTVDAYASNVKVFSRTNGSLVRVIGQAGDASGDFRVPILIQPLDSGRFVVFDQGRRKLSLRDSAGRVVDETPTIKGFFNGLVTLSKDQRIVLTGATTAQVGDQKGTELHEFALDGRRVKSYGAAEKPKSEWAKRVNGIFATHIGDVIISGSMNSNRLRLYNRATQQVSWITVAPEWYREPEWPSDKLLRRTASKQTVFQRVTRFVESQRLMNGMYPLSNGRVLIRFMTYTSPKARAFYYVVTDTSGHTWAVSRATRANVLATSADTLFWIHPGDDRPALGTGVLDFARIAKAQSGNKPVRALASR